MFDRQRASKPQVDRKAASKARAQLEADASDKEARLAELRSTMSKEKQEIDKLMSQRGGTLWTSSSEVRASPAARQAVPVKSSVARAKGGVLTETSPAKQAVQQPTTRAAPSPVKGDAYRASPMRHLTQVTSGKASGSSNQLGSKPSPQRAANPSSSAFSSTLSRTSSSSSNTVFQKLAPTASNGRTAQATARAPAATHIASPRTTGLSSGMLRSSSGNSRISQSIASNSSTSGAVTRTASGNSRTVGSVASNNSTAVRSTGGSAGDELRASSGQAAVSSGGGHNANVAVARGTAAQTSTDSNNSSSTRAGVGNSQSVSAEGGPNLAMGSKAASHGKAFTGPSLLDGDFNEDDSHASFADAVKSWRGTGPSLDSTRAQPEAAPGISSQAGTSVMTKALAAAAAPPTQTYFERLFWSQASQQAAACVTGKPVRCLAEEKEAALQQSEV